LARHEHSVVLFPYGLVTRFSGISLTGGDIDMGVIRGLGRAVGGLLAGVAGLVGGLFQGLGRFLKRLF